MPVSEMNRIERSVWIRASRARVWQALTNAQEFGKWFGVETKGQFQAGKPLEMTSLDGSCKGYVFSVEVQQMIPEQTFSWRWHPGRPQNGLDYSNEPTTLVEFTLEEINGGTQLTVVETGFDQISLARRASVFADNEGGWTYQMNAISTYVGQTQ
jgi:uncharacterized protein YndB with AHSA1/START domain